MSFRSLSRAGGTPSPERGRCGAISRRRRVGYILPTYREEESEEGRNLSRDPLVRARRNRYSGVSRAPFFPRYRSRSRSICRLGIASRRRDQISAPHRYSDRRTFSLFAGCCRRDKTRLPIITPPAMSFFKARRAVSAATCAQPDTCLTFGGKSTTRPRNTSHTLPPFASPAHSRSPIPLVARSHVRTRAQVQTSIFPLAPCAGRRRKRRRRRAGRGHVARGYRLAAD